MLGIIFYLFGLFFIIFFVDFGFLIIISQFMIFLFCFLLFFYLMAVFGYNFWVCVIYDFGFDKMSLVMVFFVGWVFCLVFMTIYCLNFFVNSLLFYLNLLFFKFVCIFLFDEFCLF